MTDLASVQAALSDIPDIGQLTLSNVGGRLVFGYKGKVIGIDPSKAEADVIADVRKAIDFYFPPPGAVVQAAPPVAPPPPVTAAPAAQPKAPAMSAPAPGSFAAGLKAIMDEARAGVAKARVDGMAQVQEAVGKLNDAKAATTHVSGKIAQTIASEAADVMAELGQISNDLGV